MVACTNQTVIDEMYITVDESEGPNEELSPPIDVCEPLDVP